MHPLRLRLEGRRGFTLVELMVSMLVLVVLSMILVSMTDQTSRTWRMTRSKIEQFQESRNAYETVTRRLTQATLNTHWDYRFTKRKAGPIEIKVPEAYIRQSELRFRSGPMKSILPDDSTAARPTHGIFFQAPFGVADDGQYAAMDNLLNTWGYFLEVDDGQESLPPFLRDRETIVPKRYASRLMELREPSERLRVYELPLESQSTVWFSAALKAPERPVRTVAENIVALVFLPRLSPAAERARTDQGKKPWLVEDYDYDSTRTHKDKEINSRHQLPPLVQVVMVAIDRLSAQKLAEEVKESSGVVDLGLKTEELFLKAEELEDDPATTQPGDGDLHKLEEQLIEKKLTYRIFNSNVVIRGAKWSVSQSE